MKKIMLCYDGSNVAGEALRVAGRQARAFSSTVFVATSLVGGAQTPQEEIDKAEQDIEYAAGVLRDEGIEAEAHLLVRGLEPGEDLLQFCREKEMDLVVLGVRKRSRVGKLLFGSTARFLILEAPCPVLSVK